MNTTINYNGPMLNFNGDEYIQGVVKLAASLQLVLNKVNSVQ